MTALYVPLAFLPLIAVAAWCDYRRKRERKPMSTTEWREGMAALEPGKPPTLRYKGAEGVSYAPRKKRGGGKVAAIDKKRTGTK